MSIKKVHSTVTRHASKNNVDWIIASRHDECLFLIFWLHLCSQLAICCKESQVLHLMLYSKNSIYVLTVNGFFNKGCMNSMVFFSRIEKPVEITTLTFSSHFVSIISDSRLVNRTELHRCLHHLIYDILSELSPFHMLISVYVYFSK